MYAVIFYSLTFIESTSAESNESTIVVSTAVESLAVALDSVLFAVHAINELTAIKHAKNTNFFIFSFNF